MKTKGWEKEFDMMDFSEFSNEEDTFKYVMMAQGKIKSFISNLLLSKQEELIGVIEGMKRYDPWANGFNIDMTDGYNQACDDLLSKVKEIMK